MRTFRVNFVLLLLFIIQSTMAFTTENEVDIQSSKNNVEQLQKDLSLSEEQVASIKAIMEKSRIQVQELQNQSFEDSANRRKAIEELISEQETAIDSILTKEQKAILSRNMIVFRIKYVLLILFVALVLGLSTGSFS